MGNKIILYPSNWLYNAGVVGFLRVLEELSKINQSKEVNCRGSDIERGDLSKKENLSQKVTQIMQEIEFKPDGEIEIPKTLFIKNDGKLFPALKFLVKYIVKDEDINEWLSKENKKGKKYEEKYEEYVKKYFNEDKQFGYEYIRARGKLFGSNTPYQNLVNENEWKEFEFVKLLEESIDGENDDNLSCNFCKRKTIKLEWLKKDKSLEKRITLFQNPHTNELGPSIGKFPNSFWNYQSSTFICPLCVFIFIHHIFAFQSLGKQQIFINAPHFNLTYDLNKFASEILVKQEYEIRKLLGSSLIQWAIKRRTLLGAWTMMNIEMIIERRVQTGPKQSETIIDYFDLPYHITQILLDHEIADLINRIGEEKIFDLIVAGKFSELEKANYFVLRALLKLKNNEKLSENDPVTKYIDDKNKDHLSKISNLLPELYAKIIKTLKSGGEI